jgi:hypothetical protein
MVFNIVSSGKFIQGLRLFNGYYGKARDFIKGRIWNECARLVSNAVIYYNSWLLSGLLEHFEQKGKEDLLEMVKKASPVAWFNLNFKGTYLFGNNKSLPTLEDLMENIVEYKAA